MAIRLRFPSFCTNLLDVAEELDKLARTVAHYEAFQYEQYDTCGLSSHTINALIFAFFVDVIEIP